MASPASNIKNPMHHLLHKATCGQDLKVGVYHFGDHSSLAAYMPGHLEEPGWGLGSGRPALAGEVACLRIQPSRKWIVSQVWPQVTHSLSTPICIVRMLVPPELQSPDGLPG